jgi:hypothetical protein
MFLPAIINSGKIKAKPLACLPEPCPGAIFMGGNGVRKSEVKGGFACEQPGTTR